VRVPLWHTKRPSPEPDPGPQPHFRVLEGQGESAPVPRVRPPVRQHSRSEWLQIHVEWPDTVTCTRCCCIVALPSPERCPLCNGYMPRYLVGPPPNNGHQHRT